MQKFYRLSAAILIVSLGLLTAPPAQAVHVIAAAVDPNEALSFALTSTGGVYQTLNRGTTWTFAATVPGAFAFSVIAEEGGNSLFVLSVQGTTLFRSLVIGIPSPFVGAPQPFFASLCSGSPIRSITITPFLQSITTVHEDGTICFNGNPIPGPGEAVAVEETTWGAVKDTYKFKD